MDGFSHTIDPLRLTPTFLYVCQIATSTLLREAPFQVQDGGDGRSGPPLYRPKVLELVLVESQNGFQLLEKQLDVPIIMPPKLTLLMLAFLGLLGIRVSRIPNGSRKFACVDGWPPAKCGCSQLSHSLQFRAICIDCPASGADLDFACFDPSDSAPAVQRGDWH